jgi:lipid II:glycine glycyltransferase (peptidoglycan interpeptide bridge formation enzyme)
MNKLNKQAWNDLIARSQGPAYQTYSWALSKELSGLNPQFLTIMGEDGELKAGLIYFEVSKKFPLIGTRKILFSEGLPPAINKEYQIKILRKFKELSKSYFYGTIYANVVNPKKEFFASLGYQPMINNTVLIPLQQSQEALWKSLEKKSARWGVKTAEKNKLTCEITNKREDIEKFYDIYSKTTLSSKFPTEKLEFLLNLSGSKIAKIFIVKSGIEIIGGALLLIDKNNKYSILNLAACNVKGLKLQAMPFLYWKLILYSKSIGLNSIDLGGYDTEAKKGDKLYNINKFKERFGGKVAEQVIFSTNKKYTILRKLHKNSRILRKLYGRK